MSAAEIVQACHGRSNRAQCPVCAEQGRDFGRNHLSVAQRDGKVLVKCFAGCEQSAVIEALRRLGVWPQLLRAEWTPEQRRRWARRHTEAESLAERVHSWHRGLVLTLEAEALEAGIADDWDRLEPAAQRLNLLNTASTEELLAWHRADESAGEFEATGLAHFEEIAAIAEDAVAIIGAAQRKGVAA
jgi:hypothetical protein